MYFMDLKLIAPLKRLNLIVETYPVWCKIILFCTVLDKYCEAKRSISVQLGNVLESLSRT